MDPPRLRMYDDLAWAWPMVSSLEDYKEESERVASIIEERSRTPARTLLHLGCGGGHNDHVLKEHFEVTGVDIAEGMLALARELNPEVAYHVGDMRDVRLGRTFDAVIALDSIGYMLTEEDLGAAFRTAFEHLGPGGTFVTLAEMSREGFEQHRTYHHVGVQGDVEVVLFESYYDPDPSDTTYEGVFVYLVRRSGELELYTDLHELGIFDLGTWRRLLEGTGFEVQEETLVLDERGEGTSLPLFVCTRPAG